MKKQIMAILAVLLLATTFVSTAHAELFSVSAGLPLSVELDDGVINTTTELESDGMPTGLLLHVKFPILVGVGLENYTQPLKAKGSTEEVELSATMYDIFYLLPIPIVNITLGLGAGTMEMESKSSAIDDSSWKKANVWQYYGQFGIPIAGVVDIHVSYHQISGEKIDLGASGELKTDSTMYALGVSVGF